MKDEDKTKEDFGELSRAELVTELVELRQRVAELEAADTEHKRAQEELGVAYDALASSVNGVIIADLERKIKYANPAFLRMFGYEDRDQVIGKYAAELFPSERVQKFSDVQAIVDRVKGETEEFLARRKDGTVFPVEVSSSVVTDQKGNDVGRMAAFVDITERKRAEEQIRRHSAVLNAGDRVFQEMLTCETEEELARTCLAVAEELTGSKFGVLGEMNPAGLFDTIAISNPGWDVCKMPDSDATRLITGMEIRGIDRSTLREGKSRIVNDPASHPDRVGTPEGHPPITCFLGVPLKQAGETIGMIGLANREGGYDVTQQEDLEALSVAIVEALMRKRAEMALRESQARLEGVLGSLEDVVWSISPHTFEVFYANPAAEKVYGRPLSEFLAHPDLWFERIHPKDRERVMGYLQALLHDGVVEAEYRILRPDGLERWVHSRCYPVRDVWGVTIRIDGIDSDVTRRRRGDRFLRALNQAALAMERAFTSEEIFSAVAKQLKEFGFHCLILLTDESQSRVFPTYSSYDAREVKAAEKLFGSKTEDLSIPIEAVDVAREVVWERKIIFLEEIEDLLRQVLPEPAKRFAGRVAKMLNMPRTIVTPLTVGDKVSGVLTVQSDDLTEEDVPAITAFADQVAAAWRKAQLMQDLETSLTEVQQAQEELQRTAESLRRTLGATIQAMAVTVETKDPYTAGHQRRVADLARAIATEMSLSREQIEGIRMAAVIHDMGKITVPTDILNKPGRLTEHEFGIIKCHPKVGYDILKTIEFPWPIAQIIFQHHERMDSSGYPAGLSGEEILLEARILGVADVVEAMASFRPYRPALGIDKALEEISQNRGVLYDPEVVAACLRLFTEKGFTFDATPPPPALRETSMRFWPSL